MLQNQSTILESMAINEDGVLVSGGNNGSLWYFTATSYRDLYCYCRMFLHQFLLANLPHLLVLLKAWSERQVSTADL